MEQDWRWRRMELAQMLEDNGVCAERRKLEMEEHGDGAERSWRRMEMEENRVGAERSWKRMDL